jgi:hypothetical protein
MIAIETRIVFMGLSSVDQIVPEWADRTREKRLGWEGRWWLFGHLQHGAFEAVETIAEGGVLGLLVLELSLEVGDLCVFLGAEFLECVDHHRFVSDWVEVEVSIFGLLDPLRDDLLDFLCEESGDGSGGV